MNNSSFYNADMIRKQLPQIIKPGRLFSVRVIVPRPSKKMRPEVYNKAYDISQIDTLISDLGLIMMRPGTGIYYTPNEGDTKHGGFGWRCRDWFLGGYCYRAVSDADIKRRNYLLIDIDPVRPADTMADENQRRCAGHMYEAVYDLLAGHFGPHADCHTVFSGNGYQMLYPTDLPAGSQYPKRLLEALSDMSNTAVKIDCTVSNAARIFRMPGTMNCKGNDRGAWCMCELLGPADGDAFISEESLRKVFGEDRPEKFRPEKYLPDDTDDDGLLGIDLRECLSCSFDLEAFITEHFPDAEAEDYEGGTKWVLDECPVGEHDHHRGEAVIIRREDGTIQYKCSHDTCTDVHWQQLRAHFDPAYAARLESNITDNNN